MLSGVLLLLLCIGVVSAAYRSPGTLWLRGNKGQQGCHEMWHRAMTTPADNFAPTILDKLLHGASTLYAPKSFGSVAVDCGGTITTTKQEKKNGIFVPPVTVDAMALRSIVETFHAQDTNVIFVLSISSVDVAKAVIDNAESFTSEITEYLNKSKLNALQLDMRLLSHNSIALAGNLSSFVLQLGKHVELSVVIDGSISSEVPLDLHLIGSKGNASGVTLVTTGTFRPAYVKSIADMTSEALGGVSLSQHIYAPGVSMSDEYNEFKPKMFQLWNEVNALKAINVSKVFFDLNILKPDTDGQRTDAYLPIYNMIFNAPRDNSEILPPLATLSNVSAWWENVTSYRIETLSKYDIKDAATSPAYLQDNTNLLSFSAPQVMLHDRFLFDRKKGEWTVPKFLDDVNERYGGVDTVLIWHNYPNIGVDDQSQFDMFHSLPGGVDEMRKVVSDFHAAGVRVLLSYNPWDSGTRVHETPSIPDSYRMVELIKAVGADGVNGDTMDGMPEEWWRAAEKLDYPVMLQPELGFGAFDWLHNITYNTMSWAYLPYTGTISDDVAWEGIADLPLVSKYSFLVSAHQAQICERWARQHVNGLQHAFFSGRGFVPWENVWGIFNYVNQGDGETLRRIRPILTFVASINLTIGGTWIPFAPEVSSSLDIVAASHFQTRTVTESHSLWLYVNRRSRNDSNSTHSKNVSDDVTFTLDADGPVCFYDLYHGKNISNLVQMSIDGKSLTFSLNIDAMDYGAVLRSGCSGDSLANGLEQFLVNQQKIVNGKSLSSFNFTAPSQPQQFRKTVTFSSSVDMHGNDDAASETVTIPEYGNYTFAVSGVQVEGWHGFPGVSKNLQPDVQFAWESKVMRIHTAQNLAPVVGKGGFKMERNLVTNEQYYAFLVASGWWPNGSSLADGVSNQNFLNHWVDSHEIFDSSTTLTPSKIPAKGTEQQPVRWVSMNDARRYCTYYKRRLPRDFEWQFAAQGGDSSRRYPWGATWDSSRVPPVVMKQEMGEPVDVGSFVNGSSTFGVQDLVGHLWQWTDEFCDAHTCRGIVRGGHWWRPLGSMWYFPQAYELTQHNTVLLLSESMDRNGGTGFRCVADL